MGTFSNKPVAELQPADLAGDLRAMLDIYTRGHRDALQGYRRVAWWRIARRLQFALEARHCARRSRLLRTHAWTFPPEFVRRVFENDGWRVWEVDAELYVNGLQVWPLAPMALVEVIDTLCRRRLMNLVPEYDERQHG